MHVIHQDPFLKVIDQEYVNWLERGLVHQLIRAHLKQEHERPSHIVSTHIEVGVRAFVYLAALCDELGGDYPISTRRVTIDKLRKVDEWVRLLKTMYFAGRHACPSRLL